MIRIRFTQDRNGQLSGFCVRGHAQFAESGRDIVCAAVSSAVYMAANTVTEVLGLSPALSERDGKLSLSLSEKEAPAAQAVLQGLRLHLQALYTQYPDYITME